MVQFSENNFYVLQFTELPYPDLKKYVVVPRSWIKGSRPRETQVFVAYPREDPQKTKKRASKNEASETSWNLYKANIKYDAKEFNDAAKWITKQPDKNRLAKDECEPMIPTTSSYVATGDASYQNKQPNSTVQEEVTPKPGLSTTRNVNKPQMSVPPLRNSPMKRKSIEENDVMVMDNILNGPLSKVPKHSYTDELICFIKEPSDHVPLGPEMMINGMTNQLGSSTNQNNTNMIIKQECDTNQNIQINENIRIKMETDESNTNITNMLQSETNLNAGQNSNTQNVQASKRIDTKRISVVSDEFLFEDNSRRDTAGPSTEVNNIIGRMPSQTVTNAQPEMNDIQRANHPDSLNSSTIPPNNSSHFMPQQERRISPNQREERVLINGIIDMGPGPALMRDANHTAPTNNAMANIQPAKNNAPNITNQPYPIPALTQVQPYAQNTRAPKHQGVPLQSMAHYPPAFQIPHQMPRHPTNPTNQIPRALPNNLQQVPHPQRFVGGHFPDFRNRNDNPAVSGNRRLAEQNMGHFVHPPGPSQVYQGHLRQYSNQAPIVKGLLLQDPQTGSIFTQECPKGNEGNSVQAGASNALSSGRNISSSAIQQLQQACYDYDQRATIYGPMNTQSARNHHHHASIPLNQQTPPNYHSQTHGPVQDTTKIQKQPQPSVSTAPNPRMRNSACQTNIHSSKTRTLQDVRQRLVSVIDSRSDSKRSSKNMASSIQNSDCSSKCQDKTDSATATDNTNPNTMQSDEAIRIVQNVGVDNIVFCLFLSYLWKSMQ